MTQNLSPSVQALAERVRQFVIDQIIPLETGYRAEMSHHHHGPSAELRAELIRRARAEGLVGPHLPKELGGFGLTHREQAAVFKAAGYAPLACIALNIMAPDEGNMHLLHKVASKAQQDRFLRPLAAGDTRSAFLMTEPDGGAGSDPGMMQTVAVKDGDDWVISGRKTFITGAQGAAFGIIMARTEHSATMFLADMSSPGIRIERVLDTIDSSMPGGHSVITLDKVRVPADQILGELDEGFRYAQVRLAPARLTHCMRWWGAAERANDIAAEFATRRHAFGKPIIDHEGVGFMLADNLIDLKQSELMIDWCADVLDAGHAGGTESSMAKTAVSEALFRVADRCVQILGGTGVSGDTVVEQIFREIRAFRIYDGPSEVHRWSLAKRVKKSPAYRRIL